MSALQTHFNQVVSDVHVSHNRQSFSYEMQKKAPSRRRHHWTEHRELVIVAITPHLTASVTLFFLVALVLRSNRFDSSLATTMTSASSFERTRKLVMIPCDAKIIPNTWHHFAFRVGEFFYQKSIEWVGGESSPLGFLLCVKGIVFGEVSVAAANHQHLCFARVGSGNIKFFEWKSN